MSPFFCRNGPVSEALYPRQRREHAGLPLKVLTVDGTTRDEGHDPEIFREMARDYRRVKPHPGRYPPAFDRSAGQVSA